MQLIVEDASVEVAGSQSRRDGDGGCFSHSRDVLRAQLGEVLHTQFVVKAGGFNE